MFDAAHQQCTIELNRTFWEQTSIVKKAGLDVFHIERSNLPILAFQLEALEARRALGWRETHGAGFKKRRRLLKRIENRVSRPGLGWTPANGNASDFVIAHEIDRELIPGFVNRKTRMMVAAGEKPPASQRVQP
jgi:hypothetical protein